MDGGKDKGELMMRGRRRDSRWSGQKRRWNVVECGGAGVRYSGMLGEEME